MFTPMMLLGLGLFTGTPIILMLYHVLWDGRPGYRRHKDRITMIGLGITMLGVLCYILSLPFALTT